MPSPARRLLALPLDERLCRAEAALFLCASTLLVKLVPYRRWGRLVGELGAKAKAPGDAGEIARASEIGHAVRSAAGWLPFEAVCLPQALAASWMLRRRSIPAALFVGVRTAQAPGKSIDLHAWLTVADMDVTGGEIAGEFTVLARFAV